MCGDSPPSAHPLPKSFMEDVRTRAVAVAVEATEAPATRTSRSALTTDCAQATQYHRLDPYQRTRGFVSPSVSRHLHVASKDVGGGASTATNTPSVSAPPPFTSLPYTHTHTHKLFHLTTPNTRTLHHIIVLVLTLAAALPFFSCPCVHFCVRRGWSVPPSRLSAVSLLSCHV